MAEHRKKDQRQRENRNIKYYPRLISFLGNTNAGKSSLIEVLMGHLWDSRITDEDLCGTPFPVVGNQDSVPTSSDIHLYRDQIEGKINPESPLLFADYEGFEAADYSAEAKSKDKYIEDMEKKAPDHIQHDTMKRKGWARNTFDKTMRFMKRNLTWSDSNIDRSKAVEELFPRLVYNISDVVVYVVDEGNFKSMGKVLEKLVKWSQKAEISSVNRMSLPSLIILINKCDLDRAKEWRPDETTDQILKENAYLMDMNKTIKNRRDELANFNLPHKSIKDILSNSYAAVKFLRLPIAKNISRLRSQFQELYAMKQLHNVYQLTFDHFSKSTTSPFNFMEAFFTVHPSPADLWSNFRGLLQATFEAVKPENQASSHQLFTNELMEAVVSLICSGIAIDSHRSQVPGIFSNIFRAGTFELPSSNQKVRDGSYERTVERALQEFADCVLPCGYMSAGSDGKKRICVNNRKSHSHEAGSHQDANGWDFVLAGEMNKLDTVKLLDLWDHHRKAIRELHDLAPKVDLRRLPSCVWCMQNFPTERFSCGHWICSSCVVEIGSRSEDDCRAVIVERCDQHPGGGMELVPPFEFLDLPKTVGRRLLSLDEGGVRGILQLELLADIQACLGEQIPIQDCFDLIGGTGIGGINALGLGISRWDIHTTIKEFKEVVPRAFVTEDWSILDFLLRRQKKNLYSPDGLTRSIQDAFGQDSEEKMTTSLSRATETGSGPIRVFVTSSRKISGGILLTNYRRQKVDINQDQIQDLSHAQKSLGDPQYTEACSVGKAAIATASFEPFFGPYKMRSDYVGGAQDFACPAEVTLLELRSLWPHVGRPDVLVSVGCGHNASATSGNSRDCTSTGVVWSKAFEEKSQKEPDRYIRLCPEFSKKSPLPNADYVSGLTNCSLRGGDLARRDLDDKVDLVARRLISTIFYFDKTSSELCEEGGWIIYGHIQCRFKETSKIIRAFGSKISRFKNPRFVRGSEVLWKFHIDTLKVMSEQGRFRAPCETGSSFMIRAKSEDEINIKFMADDFPSERISGSVPYQELVPRDEENPQSADVLGMEYLMV
ncbi:hypothetical protein F5884DRAFT_858885 [Xylogone sp. PMI_703]|nr:hypothetical protein F5884DRAFT_858885 [Xylogone sp. PMI_703]